MKSKIGIILMLALAAMLFKMLPAVAQQPGAVEMMDTNTVYIPPLRYLGSYPRKHFYFVDQKLPELERIKPQSNDPWFTLYKNDLTLSLLQRYTEDSYMPFLYYYFQPEIDSLSDVVVSSTAGLLKTDLSRAQRIEALRHLGQVYYHYADTVYLTRIVASLDSMKYKWSYSAHGPYANVGIGQKGLLNMGLGYSIGYFQPRNKGLGHYNKYHALLMGYEFNPLSLAGGFLLGGITGYGPVQFGASFIFFDTQTRPNPETGEDEWVVSAGSFRPEIGYNFGFGMATLSYNAFFKSRSANSEDLNYTRDNFPRFTIGARFFLKQKMMGDKAFGRKDVIGSLRHPYKPDPYKEFEPNTKRRR